MKRRLLKKQFTQSAGASLVEYSLLVALISSTCLASTQMLGSQIDQQLEQVCRVLGGGTCQGGDSN
jgi:Flp pilus assembly pilin Flp